MPKKRPTVPGSIYPGFEHEHNAACAFGSPTCPEFGRVTANPDLGPNEARSYGPCGRVRRPIPWWYWFLAAAILTGFAVFVGVMMRG